MMNVQVEGARVEARAMRQHELAWSWHQHFDLAQRDQNTGAGRKADQDGVGHEIHQLS